MISPLYYAAIICLLILSAFFSGSEMAFSSANRLRLESAMEAGSGSAKMACYIYDHFDDALSAILIGNNLVNIASSSLASVMAIMIAGEAYTPVATVIMTVLVIIFGETVPKIAAKKNANKMAPRVAWFIRFLTIVLKPVTWVVVGLVHLIMKPLKGESGEDDQEAAIEELQSIIETVEDEGVIDEDRSELLQAALDFSEISASEVMTSRVDMLAIDIDDSWEEILSTIENSPYSRIPVYQDSIDNIIGILYLNHFFKALLDGPEFDLRKVLMAPCYVYKTLRLPAVLNEMRRYKMHMAIVTDEYGGSMGVITMEDVLEQIVGDIWDESDVIEQDVVECETGVYELDGDLSIGEFLEVLERSEESFETDSATVGGWTLEKFGTFPQEGDSFIADNLQVTVLKMDGLRVEKVLVRVLQETEETTEQ